MGTEGTLSSVWDQHAGTVGVPGCACRSSGTHFARQFKAATGLPPHQYVILRRVERAKQLLQAGTDLSLAEVPCTPASRTRASSAGTSSASSASRRGGSGCTQESPKRPQVPPRTRPASPLGFSQDRGASRPGNAFEEEWS
jgi:hypothetical protein